MGIKDLDRLSVYSGVTEIYWSLNYDDKQLSSCPTDVKVFRPAHPKTVGFNILVHGIQCHKPQYYFKCTEPGCAYSFCTLKGWNLHHRMAHKTLLKCKDCPQKFMTPSAQRAHRNMHAPLTFTCEKCGKSFLLKVPCKCTG